MAVNDTYVPVKVSGDGVTAAFDFDFTIYQTRDLLLQLIDKVTGLVTATLVLGTDYSVAISSTTEGGTVTCVVAPASTSWLLIQSIIENTQPTSYQIDSKFAIISVEKALDRQCRLTQQQADAVNRSIKLPASLSSAGIDVELPSPVAKKIIGYDTLGTGLALYDNPTDSVAAAAASAAAALVSQNSAAASASAASTSAAAAALSAAKLTGTSVTSNSIGTGAKSFTTQGSKFFEVGRFVQIVSNANPTVNYMDAQVTAYDNVTGALTVSVSDVGGSGTYIDWTIRVSGKTGATGATGLTGSNAAKNLILNGNFNIWQRGTSFVSVASLAYTADRWKIGYNTSAILDLTQDASVPAAVDGSVPLSNFSLKIAVTTADAAVAAGDGVHLDHYIEGFNFAHIAQQTFTLSFYVRAHRTGTYCVSFVNSGSDRSYVAEYTINVADTWEKKTVTVTPSPSAGTWLYTNGIGLRVYFSLMCGSTFQTTPGSWQVGNFLATANQVNGVAATSDTWQIAQVQIERGSSATELEPVILSDEVQRCQRYFSKTFGLATLPAQNAGRSGELFYTCAVAGVKDQGFPVRFPVPMRAAPTLTFYNPSAANALWRNHSAVADSGAAVIDQIGTGGAEIMNAQVAGDATGNRLGIHYTADCEL